MQLICPRLQPALRFKIRYSITYISYQRPLGSRRLIRLSSASPTLIAELTPSSLHILNLRKCLISGKTERRQYFQPLIFRFVSCQGLTPHHFQFCLVSRADPSSLTPHLPLISLTPHLVDPGFCYRKLGSFGILAVDA